MPPRVEEVSATGVLDVIQQRANTHRDHTRGTSRTAVLWLQYMEMVNIIRTSIKVERTANWELHHQAVSEVLPHFAASGHNLYVKCARLYLQSMSNLRDDHPAVYRDFVSGLHVVRRNWSSLGRIVNRSTWSRAFIRMWPMQRPVRRVQILQSLLTKMTAKMSKRVTWKWKYESHKIIRVPCETLSDSTARVYCIF